MFEYVDEEAQRALLIEKRNRYNRLMLSLAPEDLATLRQMLGDALYSGNSDASLGSYIGRIDTILLLNHPDVCQGCGTKECRDHSLEQTAKRIAEEKGSVPEDVMQVDLRPSAGLAEAAEAAMKEYGVVSKSDGSLACANCDYFVHSLDDRMLRAPGPDGCPGCQHKSAHG